MHEQQHRTHQVEQRQRDEHVWLLLLSRAWQPLQQQVICRLLCCSNSMAELVHATCAGRLNTVLRKCWVPFGKTEKVAGVRPLPSQDIQQQQLQAVLDCKLSVENPEHLQLLLGIQQDSPQASQTSSEMDYQGVRQPAADVQLLKTHAPSRWMAKHAVLLSSLSISTEDVQEPLIAAGITAAREAAAAAGDAADAAATAAAEGSIAATPSTAAAGPSVAMQGVLPLQSLEFWFRSDGSLLCALAGSKQLTRLQVELTIQTAADPAVRAAMASLDGLRDLTFIEGTAQHVRWADHSHFMLKKAVQGAAESPSAFEEFAPVLGCLTLLTRLKYKHQVPLRQTAVQPLPPSLLSLQLGDAKGDGGFPVADRCSGLDVSHLLALTHLVMGNLQSADVLPAELLSLCVPKCLSFAPVLQLQHLQKLKVDSIPSAQELQGLAALPALQEFQLEASTCERMDPQQVLKKAAPYLAAVPLTSFKLWIFDITPDMWEGIQKCSQLTLLDLYTPEIMVALGGVAAGLKQLSALEVLRVERPGFGRREPLWKIESERDAGLRGVLKALAGLPKLQDVWCYCWRLGAPAEELVAATQLTKLGLFACDVHGGVAANLKAQLEPHGVDVAVCD